MAEQILTVVLIGKTGSGKSSLANALHQRDSFKVGDGFESETKECEAQMLTIDGRGLLVVDTPGTMDVKDINLPKGELLRTLNKCPTGVDAFLFVCRSDVRFTQEEYQAIKETLDVFGPESCKRAIVVFSNGDRFGNDKAKFAEQLKKGRKAIPGLENLMTQFGDRYVLMDNGENCKPEVQKQQMQELMSLIDTVSKLNPSKYVKKDLDAQTEEQRRRAEEASRQKKADKQEVERLKAEVQLLKVQQQRGIGITDILSSIGQSAGAVLVSPVVGAAAFIDKVCS